MSKIISQQRRGNLQQQLILWINATLIILTIIALSYDYITQKQILTSNFHASMKQAANHILLALERSQTMDAATETLREYCKVMSGHDDPYHEISLISGNGSVVVSSKEMRMSDSGVDDFTIPEELTWNTLQKGGDAYTALTLPFETKWANNNFEGAIRYIENNKAINTLLNRLFWNRTLSLVIIIIVLSLITFWILKTKVLSPLDRIFVQSYAVSTGDYCIWEYSDPGNEIGDIQKMFNYMVEKLKKHEKDMVKQERHSAVAETIAQAYYSVLSRINTIQKTCNSIRGHQEGVSKSQTTLITDIIKNECEAVLDDLSNLSDLLDDESKQEDYQKNVIPYSNQQETNHD